MPAASGFGLFDAPFRVDGLGEFTIPSIPVSSSNASANAPAASSGGFVGDIGNVIGAAVGRIADFGANLFIFDELAERGQVASTTSTTTNTSAGGTQTTTSTGSSFIKGVPNEVLFIGLAVVVVLLLLFSRGRGK